MRHLLQPRKCSAIHFVACGSFTALGEEALFTAGFAEELAVPVQDVLSLAAQSLMQAARSRPCLSMEMC